MIPSIGIFVFANSDYTKTPIDGIVVLYLIIVTCDSDYQ